MLINGYFHWQNEHCLQSNPTDLHFNMLLNKLDIHYIFNRSIFLLLRIVKSRENENRNASAIFSKTIPLWDLWSWLCGSDCVGIVLYEFPDADQVWLSGCTTTTKGTLIVFVFVDLWIGFHSRRRSFKITQKASKYPRIVLGIVTSETINSSL